MSEGEKTQEEIIAELKAKLDAVPAKEKLLGLGTDLANTLVKGMKSDFESAIANTDTDEVITAEQIKAIVHIPEPAYVADGNQYSISSETFETAHKSLRKWMSLKIGRKTVSDVVNLGRTINWTIMATTIGLAIIALISTISTSIGD